jgi:hypothetical protein
MAVDKKISQLASGAPAQAGDEYVVARSGANYKLTLTNIAASMPATTITTGNLTFSSTAQRITGDMTNATISNRLFFQTSTADSATRFGAIPSGTGTVSAFSLLSKSDPNNASWLQLGITDGAAAQIAATLSGTGSYLPITFLTGGSERVRIDTSGNVGIGTTTANAKLQIQSGTSPTQPTWAASDVVIAGNSTGNSAFYQSFSDTGGGLVFSTPTTRAKSFLLWNDVGGNSTWQNGSTGALVLNTNGAERMRIDSSGNVGIGGTADAYSKVEVRGTLPSSSATTVGYNLNATIPSGTTSLAAIFNTFPTTQAAAFTLSDLVHFRAGAPAFGAGSTVTNQIGFLANASLTGATNNFGFYSNIASGSNRWNFYAAGTAQNYFAGGTSFLTTDLNPATSNVEGVAINASRQLSASVDGEVVRINRKATDGVLINFYQDGVAEGNISVSGNTVSYNAFAGSHWSQLQDGSKPDILRGTVMESINELCVWPDGENERLPKSKVSDTAGSKKVYGVFMAWDNDWTETNDMLVTSVGAFICRVNSNVTVQEGDLLESNGDGTARVQTDDIIRSSTIGKVTSTVKTHEYADGSYCVPTVLYCG